MHRGDRGGLPGVGDVRQTATLEDADSRRRGGGHNGNGHRGRGIRQKRYRKATKAYRQDQRLQKRWDKYDKRRRHDSDLPAELPFDPQLELTLSDIQRQGDVATARSSADLAGLYSANFDPANPFSRQAELQRTLHEAHAENLTTMAARGHLYGGGLVAADRDTARAGLEAQDALARDYEGRSTEILRARDDALSDLQRDAQDALFDSTQRAAEDVESTEPGLGPGVRPRREAKGLVKPKRRQFRRRRAR